MKKPFILSIIIFDSTGFPANKNPIHTNKIYQVLLHVGPRAAMETPKQLLILLIARSCHVLPYIF